MVIKLSALDRLTARSKEIPCPVKGLDLPCWVTARPDAVSGYSRVGVDGRSLLAHRVAYLELIGDVPGGLELDHLCRVRACWNPWHLEPVTHVVNILRGLTSSVVRARHAAVTHCPQGHLYDAANTRTDPNGKRHCRACDGARRATNGDKIRAQERARYAAKKAAQMDGLPVCLPAGTHADQSGCAGKPSTDRQAIR